MTCVIVWHVKNNSHSFGCMQKHSRIVGKTALWAICNSFAMGLLELGITLIQISSLKIFVLFYNLKKT